MNNKSATYVGLALLCVAPLGYYLYRDSLYKFIKGSFRSDLQPLRGKPMRPADDISTAPPPHAPEVTYGKTDEFSRRSS